MKEYSEAMERAILGPIVRERKRGMVQKIKFRMTKLKGAREHFFYDYSPSYFN